MRAADLPSPPIGPPAARWGRGLGVVLLLVALAASAWLSLPTPAPLAPGRDLDFARRFVVVTHSALAPRHPARGAGFTADAYRVSPGAALPIDRADLDGVLEAHFQTVSRLGATVEILAESPGGTALVLRRELHPASRQGDDQPFLLLVNPRALPTDTSRILLRTAATSPGAVDWRGLVPIPHADLALLAPLPFPLVAFSGFQTPEAAGREVRVHAPGELVLLAPAGARTIDFVFGYNSAVFSNPTNLSDGATFSVTVEGASAPLLARHLEPVARPGDRLMQPARCKLAGTAPALLHFDTGPGPDGNISFDWLVWGQFQVHPPTSSP